MSKFHFVKDALIKRYHIPYRTNWEEKIVLNPTNLTRSDDAADIVYKDRLSYIITYAILMAAATYAFVNRTFAFFFMCLRASIKLHDKLFRGVSRATMFFYNNNPSGRILNRFASDINNIDTLLPPSLIECLMVSIQRRDAISLRRRNEIGNNFILIFFSSS